MRNGAIGQALVVALLLAWSAVLPAVDGAGCFSASREPRSLAVAMVARDIPPYIRVRKDRTLEGTEVELARDVAQRLDAGLELIELDSFDAVIDSVARGRVDVGISNLSITIDRAARVRFTQYYRKRQLVLVLNRLRLAANNLEGGLRRVEQIAGTTEAIGVIRNSAYEKGALKYFRNADIRKFDDYRGLVKAVEDGDLLFAIVNSGTVDAFVEEHPRLRIKLQTFPLAGISDHIAMAVTPGCDDLLSQLNAYLLVKGLRER